jgi:hypothetical protein
MIQRNIPQYNATHDVTFEAGRHFVRSSMADLETRVEQEDHGTPARCGGVCELALKDDGTGLSAKKMS